MQKRWLGIVALCVCISAQWAGAQTADHPVDAARLFGEYCSVCHGDRGDGISHAARDLRPAPRDFTAPQAAVELTRSRLIQAIAEGRPGTAMTAWKHQLSERQIGALADYIRDRLMVPVAHDASNEGRRLYAEYCSVCHGDKGNGQSRAAPSLIPRPRDFTADAARRELTRERMIFSTTYGRANTAMAAWETQLSEKQIEAVVDYVRATFMRVDPKAPGSAMSQPTHVAGGTETGVHDHGGEHQHTVPGGSPAAYFSQPFPNGLRGDYGRGEQLYAFNCVPCHGKQGDGQGPRAFFILPKPRDFTHPAARASMNRPHLYEAIAKGVRGAEMPAWDKVLTPQQLADISEYMLRRFIRPEMKTHASQGARDTDAAVHARGSEHHR